MKRMMCIGVVLATLFFGATIVQAQEHWPQWRGADHNSISSDTGVPTSWNETDNVIWRVKLPSWGGSSPVVWGDKVIVISPAASDGKHEGGDRDPGGDAILVLCLSTKDGSTLWTYPLDTGNKLNRKGNSASPSPLTDGSHIWATSGNGAVAMLDMSGKKLWTRNIPQDYGKLGQMFGYGSSPILHDGKLIFQVLHGYLTDEPSYLLALNAQTGETVWHVERPTDAVSESPDAYTTPTLLHLEDTVLFAVAGGDYVTGHSVDTGEEIWRAAGLNPNKDKNWRIIPSPIACDGMVYASSRKRPFLALRGDGKGDVTESHLAWKWDIAGAPDVPTPICDDTYLYLVDDRGVIHCLNPKTGEVIWGPERTIKGTVSASPVLVDNKLYIINEDATTSVAQVGESFELLATNVLPEAGYTLASPAVANNRLYLRTEFYMYCVGE